MSQQVGRYEIISEIGSGGFSTVFLARDPLLDREVALKIMRPLLMSDPDFVTRFQREAQVAANLQHPHIVPIHDYGEEEGRLFLVMKRMQTSVARLLERGALDWPVALKIVTEVAAGLGFAHARGVVHRDIKPDNILLEEETNTVTLADFGIVKALGRSTITLSLSGGILGTPAYVAPEIWNGDSATPASDIYALACVLFEMVTGEKLFEGPTPPATMNLHFRPPQYPDAWPAGVPPGLARVLDQALARDPTRRYPSAEAFANALTALGDDPLAETYFALRDAFTAKEWDRVLELGEAILAQDASYEDVPQRLQQAVAAQSARSQRQLATSWRENAEGALLAGDWDAAVAASQQWLQLAPDDDDAQAALARAEAARDRARSDRTEETPGPSDPIMTAAREFEAVPKEATTQPAPPEQLEATETGPASGAVEHGAPDNETGANRPGSGPADSGAPDRPARAWPGPGRRWLASMGALAAIVILALLYRAVFMASGNPEPVAQAPAEPAPELMMEEEPAGAATEVSSLLETEVEVTRLVEREIEVTRVVESIVEVEVPDQRVVIEFWTTDSSEEQIMVYEEVAARFMAANPGLSVSIVPIEETGINLRLDTARWANRLPDVVRMGIEHVAPLAAEDLLDQAAATAVIADIGADDFYTGPLAMVADSATGLYSAVPYDGWIQAIWYRRDLFSARGLAAPTSWDAIATACEALAGTGNLEYGITLATDPGQSYGQQVFEQVAISNNAWPFDAGGNVTMNSQEMVEALAFYAGLQACAAPGPQYWRGAREYYEQDQAGMLFYSTYIMDDLVDGSGLEGGGQLEIAVADLAANTGFAAEMRGPNGVASYGDLNVLGIMAGADEDARRLVSYFLTEGYADVLSLVPYGKIPVLKSARDQWQNSSEYFAHYSDETLDEIAAGHEHLQRWQFRPDYDAAQRDVIASIESQLLLPRAISAIALDGSMTPESAAAWLQEQVVALAAEQGG